MDVTQLQSSTTRWMRSFQAVGGQLQGGSDVVQRQLSCSAWGEVHGTRVDVPRLMQLAGPLHGTLLRFVLASGSEYIVPRQLWVRWLSCSMFYVKVGFFGS